MIKEREFYVWNTDSNRMIGVTLAGKGLEEVINDVLSDKEYTSVSSN